MITTVLVKAISLIGTPYIWAGKGDWCVRDGRVQPIAVARCPFGVDCSGLVTMALKQAGGPDLRGMWGAEAMRVHLPPPDSDEKFRLRLYGTPTHATHVAFDLGNGLVLEAAGGDSTTLDAEEAAHRGARVRIGFELRHDFIGERSLRALLTAPAVPPNTAIVPPVT